MAIALLLLNLYLRDPSSITELMGTRHPHPAGIKEMLHVSAWLGVAEAAAVAFVLSCALIARRRATLIDRALRVGLALGEARTRYHNLITRRPRRPAAFTYRARQVVVLAQEEARMLNHNYIGTEHILLGLIHGGEGVAAKALESLGISLDAVRQQVKEIIGQGQQAPSGHIRFTPRAKKVLKLSLREALQLGHSYIGTEHILLGLIREGDGVAAQVLVKLGADLNRVRQQAIRLMREYQAVTSERSKQVESLEGSLERVNAGIAQLTQTRDYVQAQITALEQLRAKLESQVGRARQAGREHQAQEALTRLNSLQSQIDGLKSSVDRLLADRVKLTTMAQMLQAKIDGADGIDVR